MSIEKLIELVENGINKIDRISYPHLVRKYLNPYLNDMQIHQNLHNSHTSLNSSILCVICKDDYADEMLVNFTDNIYTNFKKSIIKNSKPLLTDYIDLIKYLTFYLCINLFIFDSNVNKIYCEYHDDECNVFKPFVLMIYENDKFCVISYKHSFMLNYNNDVVKKILNVDYNIINCLDENKTFIFDTSVDKDISIIEPDCMYEELSSDNNNGDDDYNTYDNYENIGTKYNPSDNSIFCKIKNDENSRIHINGVVKKLNERIKLIDLQRIAEEHGVNILNDIGKRKTKKILISEINDKFMIHD